MSIVSGSVRFEALKPYYVQSAASTFCIPPWGPQELLGLINDDEALRKRLLAQIISVRLLVKFFTPP